MTHPTSVLQGVSLKGERIMLSVKLKDEVSDDSGRHDILRGSPASGWFAVLLAVSYRRPRGAQGSHSIAVPGGLETRAWTGTFG